MQLDRNTRNLMEAAAMIAQKGELLTTFNHNRKEFIEKIKEMVRLVDFKKVNKDIAVDCLLFGTLTKEKAEDHKFLVPLWLFNYLPEDMELECINGNIEKRKDADNDIRFGCVAYMIEVGSENKK